jgi:hypothetical protein
VKIEIGKKYRTTLGMEVEIVKDAGHNGFCMGDPWGRWWMKDGRGLHPNGNEDIISEVGKSLPYEMWVHQQGDSIPMPTPDERVARGWAEKSGGRAFKMREVVE